MENQQPNQANLKSFPDKWNGPFDLYKYSKQIVMLNLTTLLILFVADLVVALILQFILKSLGSFLGYIIGALFEASLIFVFLEGAKGHKIEIGDALNNGVKHWLNFIFLLILTGLSVTIGLILFIIPGLFIIPRLVLAPYFLIDQNMNAIDAYKASWDATKGHALKAWGIIAVSVLFGILVIVIIGIYFVIIYSAATAVFYLLVTKRLNVAAPATPTQQPLPTATPAPQV